MLRSLVGSEMCIRDRLFRGSESIVENYGGSLTTEETINVHVTWDDINDTSTVVGNTQATVPFTVQPDDILSEYDSRTVPRTISPPIYNYVGDYVGVLAVTENQGQLQFQTTGAASNISNQRIRRIWSKFK